MLNFETFVEIIKQFGFPVFVCVWFMIRDNKVIKANTEAINELKEIILKRL